MDDHTARAAETVRRAFDRLVADGCVDTDGRVRLEPLSGECGLTRRDFPTALNALIDQGILVPHAAADPDHFDRHCAVTWGGVEYHAVSSAARNR